MSSNHRLSGRRVRELRWQLAQRDGDICALCGEPFREVSRGSIYAKSIDHVVRVSDGGTNDLSNLRLAHVACNRMRERVSA